MNCRMTRRRVLSALGATAAGTLLNPLRARAAEDPPDLPVSPVAITRCTTYGDGLEAAVAGLFDLLGGVEDLVRDKTVAIKVNLVADPYGRLQDLPLELTHWTHPAVIRAAVALLGRAGAARIRVLECCGDLNMSFADYVREAGWDPDWILGAAPNVELQNTNGPGTDYARFWCPNGGLVFPGYDLHSSYADCDVMVSIPKMKEHHWFGVTLSMKNGYGMTPLTIYGSGADTDAPSLTVPQGNRTSVFHAGTRPPSLTAPQELDPASPRIGGYRLPRIIAEINSARPFHLAIIDGIETMAGGEGPWYEEARPVKPGVLLAGFNAVNTDAVAMAVMGFDPMAGQGQTPFDDPDCENFLSFAAQLGLGSRDLSAIPVLGTSIEDARFDFRSA